MADFFTCIEFAKTHLNFKHELKEKQVQTLQNLYEGRDVISVLPTGYGKSIIFQLLPWLFQRKYDSSTPCIVLVICPLNSIMEDQVMGLRERGISACYISGSVGKTFMTKAGFDYDSSEDEDESAWTIKDVSFKDISDGKYNIIYAHPESALCKKMYSVFRSALYQTKICCVVIDEVHMVSEWGEEFRPKFKKLGDLTCLFDNCAHLAVTATSSPSSILDLSKTLQYKNHVIVTVNPDRPNIYIDKKPRLPNSNKTDKYDELIDPLAQELKIKLRDFPVTVLYVESLDALGYYYQYLNYTLKELQYHPTSDKTPEARIFAQYHTDYTQNMKKHILQELRKDNPHVRLVLATVALGMGLNAPGITRIIHARPPTTLEKYLQEIGRAGRTGQKSTAILHYNKSDIAKNRKGLSPEMAKFCNVNDGCLRLELVKYFGFQTTVFDGPLEECCSLPSVTSECC
ncbi:bifunctional 3'-5' exonuclease/ATP-dependent helicase WRN-like [Ylistrum balloti]|uniref:bifunctional 3'-5' exonuclease/ATP-dependent helicase WRN-like n=2 Tax=Ylistrum balloti TaxID=509963 RepID=UPI002905E6AE|nr:bifunctional 3'-5' exonuclease/ATP-dependent helicase WRN-like [Ylistrum balloti]